MEDSSHSTPSPMSSAASSQDSLHRNRANAAHLAALQAAHAHQSQHQQHQQQHDYYGAYGGPAGPHSAASAAQMMMAGAGANKKNKGVKSTLGRIFGKKDKQLKAMKVSGKGTAAFIRSTFSKNFHTGEVARLRVLSFLIH